MPLSLINVNKELLDLEFTGDFDVKASDLQTNDLTIQASGNGNYTLGGNVDYASLDFLGNMTLDTEDLETSVSCTTRWSHGGDVWTKRASNFADTKPHRLSHT